MGRAISVPMLRRAFRLSVRRIAGYLENGQPLDLTSAQDATEAVADREEEFIYRGQPDFQLPGLLTLHPRHLQGADRGRRLRRPARRRAGTWAGILQAGYIGQDGVHY
jgi:hypothetical protein